jgi:hypothetical protein
MQELLDREQRELDAALADALSLDPSTTPSIVAACARLQRRRDAFVAAAAASTEVCVRARGSGI